MYGPYRTGQAAMCECCGHVNVFRSVLRCTDCQRLTCLSCGRRAGLDPFRCHECQRARDCDHARLAR